ncbi:MAG: DUF4298 domain-containing protein [Erysipelotrichaceae bacterium]|nr:DUF4298 domain-containing protein [Erysipelotrichaceae bacterium]
MMKKTKQIERIEEMEALMDECSAGMKDFQKSLRKFSALQKKIDLLEEYYFSPEWRKDYEDDEAGKIPQEVKRGVLSQDGVYDLLGENDEIMKKLERFLKRMK